MILAAAMEAAVSMERPGTILEFPYRWRRFPVEEQPAYTGVSHGARHPQVEAIGEAALAAVRSGARILLITDRLSTPARPPVPSLLALRAVVCTLNSAGLRLECSIVMASAEVRTAHHVAALIGFGEAWAASANSLRSRATW